MGDAGGVFLLCFRKCLKLGEIHQIYHMKIAILGVLRTRMVTLIWIGVSTWCGGSVGLRPPPRWKLVRR